jgi:copper chaperone CopZ
VAARAAVEQVPGVAAVEANPIAREVKVSVEGGKESLDAVVEALRKAGFVVEGDPRPEGAAGSAAP